MVLQLFVVVCNFTLRCSSGDLGAEAVAHLYELLFLSAQTGDAARRLLQPDVEELRVVLSRTGSFKPATYQT